MKILSALMITCMICAGVNVNAATTTDHTKKVVKKKTGTKTKAKSTAETAEKPGPDLDDDDKEFVPGDSAVIELQCELGNKLTLYRNANDDQHMALRWHKRVHRMTRATTTTGADRFESPKFGLTWIGIPAKGMLLDSRQGRQLANECRDAEQLKAKGPDPVDTTKSADIPPPIKARKTRAKVKS